MYQTSDLYLAAYLRSLNYELSDVDKSNKTVFIFTQNDKMKQDILNYFNDKGSVIPRRFINCIKDMKTLAFIR